MSEFAALLASKRAAAGLSLRQLSEQTGVGFTTIMRTERGELPRVDSFLRLCRWMDVQVPSSSFVGSPRRWVLQAGIPWLGRLS